MRCRRTRFKSEVNYSGKLWALFLRRFRKVAASSFVFSKKICRKNVSTKSLEFMDQSYSEKDFICRKTHDKKKEEVKPKISGEKNVSTKMFRVFSNWGLAV